MADPSWGWVYFLRCPSNGLIKIGWTRHHPDGRLRRFQAASPVPIEPLAVIEGCCDQESALHARFALASSHAEWFRPALSLLRFIEANGMPWPKSEKGPPRQRRRIAKPFAAIVSTRPPSARPVVHAIDRRLLGWGNRFRFGEFGGDASTIKTAAEWAEELDISLGVIRRWYDDGVRYDLVGYCRKMRAEGLRPELPDIDAP